MRLKYIDLDLASMSIVPETGAFEAWKQGVTIEDGRDTLIHLLIPKGAKRVGGHDVYHPRKCRASYAFVLGIYNNKGRKIDSCRSLCSYNFIYRTGAYVRPRRSFNKDHTKACASGIHFFLTKAEAINY